MRGYCTATLERSTSQTNSKAIMPPKNASIGLLAQLPREVRNLIWENFVPSFRQRTYLGILQSCRQLYEEVALLVYQSEVLQFHISPIYQYRSWLSIVTRRGAELHLCDLQDAISRGFSSLPYKKLKGIRVEIEAPDSTDPGQMICLWKKVVSLVDLLSQVDGLPDLEIHLINSEPSKLWSGKSVESEWSTAGIAQKSIPYDHDHEYYNEYDRDFEAILQPFCRLRNARSASMHIATEIDTIGHVLENIASFMISDKPFGHCMVEGKWSDDSTQNYLDTNFLQFDNALDNLPGRTACMLRLERFSTWFEDGLHSESKYLNELERICHSDHLSSEHMNISIYSRYRMMLSFNPLSAMMQEMRFQKYWWIGNGVNRANGPIAFPLRNYWSADTWRRYSRMFMIFDNDQCLKERGGPYESRWDKEEWHQYYKEGIPRLDSEFAEKLYIQTSDLNGELDRDAFYKCF